MNQVNRGPSESPSFDEAKGEGDVRRLKSPETSRKQTDGRESLRAPRGGARRKVLPPIAQSTSTRSKAETDLLESVLPLPNLHSSNTSSLETHYKANLPSLTANSPMTSKQCTSRAYSQLSSAVISSNCASPGASPNASIDVDTWGSLSSPVNEEASSSEKSQSSLFSDSLTLMQEPPVSPLPTQFKLVKDSAPCSAAKCYPQKGIKRQSLQSKVTDESVQNRISSSSSKMTPGEAGKRFQDKRLMPKRGQFLSFKQFRNEVQKWRKSGNSSAKSVHSKLQDFYKTTFDSFTSINETFKKRTDGQKSNSQQNRCQSALHQVADPLIEQKFVGMMYEVLHELAQETQKIVLKGIINCLLNEWRGAKTENEVRAYYILLQNPQFGRSSTYVIYAHLLRQIGTLHEKEQNLMTQWLRRLSTPRFRPIVERIHQFITLRLFPDKNSTQQELPPMSKCPWWIPSAMKVLTLFYNANNLIKPRLISFREFYNASLDHIDVMAEFKQWQSQASHPGFTFCQYPYVLSLCARRHILRRDQERQMIRTARDELVTSVRRRPTRPPDVNQLFLNIRVRRQHLLQDSLAQIYSNRKHLKKKLRVEFIGEPGYDMGGLTKEWFLLLLRQVLLPDYGTFIHNEKTRTYWFATNENENFSDYFLIGVLMGLAVYNCITLDLRFPLVLYRKLLDAAPPSNQAKPPVSTSPTSIPVGLISVTLDELKDIDPDMVHGLEELLSYEGDIEEDFGISFQASKEEFGILKTHLLKPGGDEIPVTNGNRKEYVQCYLNCLLNKAVYRQFSAFYEGFHTVCDSSALSLLCAEEVETLVCGNSIFDLRDLKKFTTYEGFAANDPTIIHFWDVTLTMQRDMQKKLLHFCTGSDRVPIGGMQDLKFKIIRAPTAQNMLPMAHTCFNQLLLPPYGSRSQLEQKLTIAVSNAEGFGLE